MDIAQADTLFCKDITSKECDVMILSRSLLTQANRCVYFTSVGFQGIKERYGL